jgi:hypothetical protein
VDYGGGTRAWGKPGVSRPYCKQAVLSSEVDTSGTGPAAMAGIRESPRLARRFEAVVFDWDGTVVPGRRSDATRIRGLVEQASAHRLDLAVVSGTDAGNVEMASSRPGPPVPAG